MGLRRSGLQYDTTINDWHTCPNTDRINASNPCSEYMFLDNSACNLSSINLSKFLDEEGRFDIEGYRQAIRVLIIAMDIAVDYASYPTPGIAKNSHNFRPLGLGYANLGTLLMQLGIPYDSDEGGRSARRSPRSSAVTRTRRPRRSRGKQGPVHGLPAQPSADASCHGQAP